MNWRIWGIRIYNEPGTGRESDRKAKGGKETGAWEKYHPTVLRCRWLAAISLSSFQVALLEFFCPWKGINPAVAYVLYCTEKAMVFKEREQKNPCENQVRCLDTE